MGSQRDSVLFVDDERNVLVSLRRLLVEEPYEVRVQTDPIQALEEIAQDPPTVVVADYMMPQMTGPEFLGKVKQMDAGIVRMMLTGKPDILKVLRAINQGAVYRFVLKPWDDDELRMVIHNAVDYAHVTCERDRLLEELDEQRSTLQALERRNPGITKLPPRDEDGAFVLDAGDLPKRS